jgi:hypothetical protein
MMETVAAAQAAGEAGTSVALVPRVTMTYGLAVQQLGAPPVITVCRWSTDQQQRCAGHDRPCGLGY